MGQPDVARVDVAALHDVAAEYDAAADTVEGAVRTHLSRAWCSAAPPRVACTSLAATRCAPRSTDVVDRLPAVVAGSREIAAALRASADRYAEADARAARRVG